MEFHLQLLKLQ